MSWRNFVGVRVRSREGIGYAVRRDRCRSSSQSSAIGRRCRRASRLLVVGALALAGCSSSGMGGGSTSPTSSPAGSGSYAPLGSAADAFKRWVQEYSDGQYDRMWQSLAIEQQAFTPEARFMSCRAQTVNRAGINSVSYDKTTATYASTVSLPGTSKTIHSTAVTAQVSINAGAQTTKVTTHWFVERGMWRWSQDQASVDAFKAGHCPN